jgi:hypothetical protein
MLSAWINVLAVRQRFTLAPAQTFGFTKTAVIRGRTLVRRFSAIDEVDEWNGSLMLIRTGMGRIEVGWYLRTVSPILCKLMLHAVLSSVDLLSLRNVIQ